jgi:hypothetical protein
MGHSQFPVDLAVVGQVVEKGFAVLGNEGVEIDERANPVRHPVGDVAYDDTAVGVSEPPHKVKWPEWWSEHP